MLQDAWVRSAASLALVHGAMLAIVYSRPGLPAVILWYLGPPLVALGVAILLTFALIRSWRGRSLPSWAQLAGFGILAALMLALGTFRTFPSSHDAQASDVSFRLPLDGPVTIAWGGPDTDVNYHAVMPDQRWAYDVLVTRDGRSFRNNGTRLEDYYAYGLPVLAPADGVIHEVRDGEPDEAIGHWQVRRATGNHVILQVAPAEFLFVAHLQLRSLTVTRGQRVRAGQLLGRVGNSGNASEPHVHLHLQDTPTPYLGEGIPFYFHGYSVNGLEMQRGMPTGGRSRRSRWWPGAFVGEVVQNIAGS